jgi:HTH-type transcriptional regulator/antitoxin MqsA
MMNELNVCTICGGALTLETRKAHFTYKERSLDLDQSGLYCQNCGEGFLSPTQSRSNDKALRAFRNKVDGLLTPDKIRAIRKHLNLSQTEAGRIFGGGPMAFSKYERGECAHSRALDIILRLLDAGNISLNTVKAVETEGVAV